MAVTNGLFTTLVDFGPGVLPARSNWLELAVSTNGTGIPAVAAVSPPWHPGSQSRPRPMPSRRETPTIWPVVGAAQCQQRRAQSDWRLAGNFVGIDLIGATIGGGGATNSVAIPIPTASPAVLARWAVALNNTAGGYGTSSTVAEALQNTASGYSSTVAGGNGNNAIGGHDIQRSVVARTTLPAAIMGRR